MVYFCFWLVSRARRTSLWAQLLPLKVLSCSKKWIKQSHLHSQSFAYSQFEKWESSIPRHSLENLHWNTGFFHLEEWHEWQKHGLFPNMNVSLLLVYEYFDLSNVADHSIQKWDYSSGFQVNLVFIVAQLHILLYTEVSKVSRVVQSRVQYLRFQSKLMGPSPNFHNFPVLNIFQSY